MAAEEPDDAAAAEVWRADESVAADAPVLSHADLVAATTDGKVTPSAEMARRMLVACIVSLVVLLPHEALAFALGMRSVAEVARAGYEWVARQLAAPIARVEA